MHIISVKLSELIKKKLPSVKLGCITCNVVFQEKNQALIEALENKINDVSENVKLEEISQLDEIFNTREAYKILGKKPSRYRPSAEALYRRIARDIGLYYVNNIVDVTNLISLESCFSIGTYDLKKIDKEVIITIGEEGDTYEGIRKDDLNISNLPVVEDSRGKFGNPCSDSQRAMIDETTTSILMIIWDFGKGNKLTDALQFAEKSLKEFCKADNLKAFIID